jgi:hypothetical protein
MKIRRHNALSAIHVRLPAEVGERFHVFGGDLAGQFALVTGWRLTRPGIAVGGALDGEPRLTLQVLTDQGDEHWLSTM